MKTAIIIGARGQDGQLLSKYLLKKNYSVIEFDKNYSNSFSNNWDSLIDISSSKQVTNLIKTVKPDEVYYLAAHHHSSEDVISNDEDIIEKSYKVNLFSYINFLQAIKNESIKTKIFYAASSLLYGNTKHKIQNEQTPFYPNCIYSITKYNGLKISEYYRDNFSVFSSVGILFNHESHLRTKNFVSKKIVKTAVDIKRNKKKELIIGDMYANIDWGYAGDFVKAFVKILNIDKSDTFIIATGKNNKLKNFIAYVFNYLDLDWKNYVKVDSTLLNRKSKKNLCGDFSKLNIVTGWKPKKNLKQLAELMVDKELELIS